MAFDDCMSKGEMAASREPRFSSQYRAKAFTSSRSSFRALDDPPQAVGSGRPHVDGAHGSPLDHPAIHELPAHRGQEIVTSAG
jgi:hypothetical protein